MVYTPLFQTEDTLALTMNAGASSATLTSGNFGSPTGTEILVIDYNVPAKAAAFKCSIAGTAVTNMVRIAGPDVEHAATAKVGSMMTPEHYRVLATMEGMDDNVLAGWITANETWTYASATTFTVAGDQTDRYAVGDKIKLTQTTVKYFSVIAVSYSAPNTTVTVTGGSDYTLDNAAITSPYYSKATSPVGFPQWFSYAVTASGVTGGTFVGRFRIVGRSCRVIQRNTANGTGSATSRSYNAPVAAAAASITVQGVATTINNGAVGLGKCTIAATASTINVYLSNEANWTASGESAFSSEIEYEI